MHELSTCQKLIRELEEIAIHYPGHKLTHIRLSVGALARVDVNELQELFPLAAKDTFANQAILSIESIPIEVLCPKCGTSSQVTANDLRCKQCSYEKTTVISGTDMLIEDVTFEA